MHAKFRLIIMLLGCLLIGNALAAEKKPLEYFFKKPQYAGFRISPNGQKLGVLAPYKGRMNLVVMNVDMTDPKLVTAVKEQDVNSFMWATNDRLLFFMDKDGSESFGIFAVDADGDNPKVLVAPAEHRARAGAAVIRTTAVLDRLKSNPDFVLVTNNKRRAQYPDVYKLNIRNGQMRMVHMNPGTVQGWFVDWDGQVFGAAFNDGLYNGYMLLDEDGEWTEMHRSRYDEHGYAPVGLTGDGETGYVSSRVTPSGETRDKSAIYEFNFKTKEFGDLVFEHPRVDVSAVGTSEKTRDIVSVSYMYDKPVTVYVDPKWKDVMGAINQALPDTYNVMSSMDENETIGVLTSFSSRQPPVYYLYDAESRQLRYLAESRPWVKPEEMAETRSFEFKARDGLTLQGYLTLPPGADPDARNLPTIVHPHGGPWARDGWGYNPEVQFLASRGYAVVQVNFRGSTGFGMKHYLASRKQWGRAMQNDVTDALAWAVDQGVADADRVCIYGASYGGYATMAGLTYTPDLYQCGINYVGVTDLEVFFKTMPDAWGAAIDQMAEMVADPDEEEEFLQEWSPSRHADRIRAPVFMAYGLRDPRVNIKHAKVMEDALEKHGKEYELMVKSDEGHGFRKQENQYDFYARVESFLAQNLKP